MRWPNDIIPRNPRELLEARREYTAEQLRNQLPANQQAAARQDALRLTKTEEAARERAAAVAAAQQEQAARRVRFLGIYDRIQDAIRAAEGQRAEALLCGDLEAALAAQQRIDGLRPLIPALRDVARRDLGPSVHLAQLERV